MEDNYKEHAYEKWNVPRYVNIKGYDLTYKDPPLKKKYIYIYIDVEKLVVNIMLK